MKRLWSLTRGELLKQLGRRGFLIAAAMLVLCSGLVPVLMKQFDPAYTEVFWWDSDNDEYYYQKMNEAIALEKEIGVSPIQQKLLDAYQQTVEEMLETAKKCGITTSENIQSGDWCTNLRSCYGYQLKDAVARLDIPKEEMSDYDISSYYNTIFYNNSILYYPYYTEEMEEPFYQEDRQRNEEFLASLDGPVDRKENALEILAQVKNTYQEQVGLDNICLLYTSHSNNRLSSEKEKLLEVDPKAGTEAAQEKVDAQKDNLSREKEVIDHEVEGDCQGKDSPALVHHQLLDADEQKREESDNFVKVVEKDIIYHEAGKSVEHCADDCHFSSFGEPSQKGVAGGRGSREFEHKQRRHQIGKPIGGEGDGQPKKWAAEQVEPIGADKVGPEVGCPAPAGVPCADRVVRELVKRDLLHVVIPVKEKQPLVHNQEGEKHDSCDKCREHKDAQTVFRFGFPWGNPFLNELVHSFPPLQDHFAAFPSSFAQRNSD